MLMKNLHCFLQNVVLAVCEEELRDITYLL